MYCLYSILNFSTSVPFSDFKLLDTCLLYGKLDSRIRNIVSFSRA
jgi:hypothetical protein